MRLEGKKTYITAIVLALASFAMAMGWLSQDQYEIVIGLLTSLGLAALRAGVGKGTPGAGIEDGQQESIPPTNEPEQLSGALPTETCQV